MPSWAWRLLRIATLALTGALLWLLVFEPDLGLTLFWRVAIPILPLLFLAAPGIWRNVCPMAFLNQLPVETGLGWNRRLPAAAQENAYLVAVAALFGLVFLRHPLLNLDAGAVAAMLGAALVLALIGGIVFSGRSGWCGTFCPISPVGKCYGQAPLLVVPNDYCGVCVRCQKNCYDINPNATIFRDLAEGSDWYVTQHKLFFEALPGLLYWFFTTAGPAAGGYGPYLAGMVGHVAISVGLFYLIVHLTPLRLFYAVQLFTVAAILIFYWFVAPILRAGLIEILPIDLPGWTVQAFQGLVVLVLATTWIRGLAHERAFRRRVPVADRWSGRSFEMVEGQPMLEAIESAGIPIRSLCRRGHCGCDPIAILDGAGNVEPPEAEELQTLRRLGLEGEARLACCCVAHGPVKIDVRPCAGFGSKALCTGQSDRSVSSPFGGNIGRRDSEQPNGKTYGLPPDRGRC